MSNCIIAASVIAAAPDIVTVARYSTYRSQHTLLERTLSRYSKHASAPFPKFTFRLLPWNHFAGYPDQKHHLLSYG
jgi:hypothetical protein